MDEETKKKKSALESIINFFGVGKTEEDIEDKKHMKSADDNFGEAPIDPKTGLPSRKKKCETCGN